MIRPMTLLRMDICNYRSREIRQARCRSCRAVLSPGFALPAAIDAWCEVCASGWPIDGLPIFPAAQPLAA